MILNDFKLSTSFLQVRNKKIIYNKKPKGISRNLIGKLITTTVVINFINLTGKIITTMSQIQQVS